MTHGVVCTTVALFRARERRIDDRQYEHRHANDWPMTLHPFLLD
jgi:hypothetical protein